MKLTDNQIETFYRFFFPEETDEQISAKANALRDRIRDGTDSLDERFIHFGSGSAIAIGSISKLQSGVYGLTSKTIPSKAAEGTRHVLLEALDYLKSVRGNKLHYRAVIGQGLPDISETLSSLGFKKLNQRIEYRSPLSDLPGVEGTPLQWHPMKDKLDPSLKEHAKLLEACGQGDPDWNADDNALELLKEYLSDSALNGSADCVQTGMNDGRPAAIIVAQVNPISGWSRITYMGILPEFRGKGLGRWVHRHGFSMMKAQGGKLYHGGTLANNAPMRKLFEKHGCTEHQRMEEWVFDLDKEP